ncbi:MAG: QueT transporter family protein [Clostridia bacterium]|nr:QueT transporter family protein [Clostridia bacterium]
MNKRASLSRFVVTAALISAAYAVLTYVSATLGLAYLGVQFRLSEALNILAVFTPAAVPGLAIGCVIGNLGSPLGIIDVIVGTLATLLSAVSIRIVARVCKKTTPFLSIILSTLFNAILVGLEIVWLLGDSFTLVAFLVIALQVAIGEIVVCSVLGLPLYYGLKKQASRLF